MIDVARIDHWAASGSGVFHRATVSGKLLFFVLVTAASVAAKNPSALLAGYAVLAAAAAASGLPWRHLIGLSAYAAIFAVLFAVSLAGSARIMVLFVAKAVTPALAVAMLIASTPYPRIFAVLSAWLPEVLAAGLFMAYRTLFILLDMMNNFVAAIRLRGGFSPGRMAKNGSNIAQGIGMLLVRAVEHAQRLYAVMTVRGYSGSMAAQDAVRWKEEDWFPLGTGGAVLLLALLWR